MNTDVVTTLRFTVYGRPQQRGSKQAVLIPKRGGGWIEKNGRPIVAAKDDNPKSKEWMATVSQVAGEYMRDCHPRIDGAVRLNVQFYFKRPNSHYRSGKNSHLLKADAPMFHVQTPDLAKLVRCYEDALTGIVWTDDKQVCFYGDIGKHWTEDSERAECVIEEIETL